MIRTSKIVLLLFVSVQILCFCEDDNDPSGDDTNEDEDTGAEEPVECILAISGMAGEGGPLPVQEALEALEGVVSAEVTYEPPEATVVYCG